MRNLISSYSILKSSITTIYDRMKCICYVKSIQINANTFMVKTDCIMESCIKDSSLLLTALFFKCGTSFVCVVLCVCFFHHSGFVKTTCFCFYFHLIFSDTCCFYKAGHSFNGMNPIPLQQCCQSFNNWKNYLLWKSLSFVFSYCCLELDLYLVHLVDSCSWILALFCLNSFSIFQQIHHSWAEIMLETQGSN